MKLNIMVLGVILVLGCKKEGKVVDPYVWIPIEVTATAYNSLKYQTSATPEITAWGDSLHTGKKSIAVSRDLIIKGLKHNTMVRIDTMLDTFYINDKMHRKWNNRIDIYMDKDRKKALEWGKRKVCIEYAVLRDSLTSITTIK